jgi:hypothetical protein
VLNSPLMKFQLDCAVHSKVILAQDITYRNEGKETSFLRDDKGVWNRIRISANVKHPELFKWGMQPVTPLNPQRAPWAVHAQFDENLYGELISELQCLESTLSMTFPVQSVNWGSPKLNVVFESEEEAPPAERAPLLDFKMGRGELKPVSGRDREFAALALTSRLYKPLVDIQSFYREGENELSEAKFINSFYNYYFALEGLYGKGKTKNAQVLEAFRSSAELKESLNRYLNDKHDIRHINQVKSMLDRMKQPLTFDGFMHVIVHTRGDLHHFVNSPNRPQPTPFHHEDFEGITFLVKYLARMGILASMLRLNPIKK